MKVKKLLYRTFIVTIIIIFTLFVLGHIKGFYLFDLVNNFRPFLIVAATFIILTQIETLRLIKTSVLLVLIIILNFHMFNLKSSRSLEPVSNNFSILQLNLNMENRNYAGVRKLIAEKNPDIISLQECTPEWFMELQGVLSDYTLEYKLLDSPFGICLASKIPVNSSEILYVDNTNTPYVEFSLNIKGKIVTLVSIHPVPPINQNLFVSRNSSLEGLIESYSNHEPLIIVGDLNITPWSPYYQKLIKTLKLKSSSSIFDTTWPDYLLVPLMKIDHILLTEEFIVKESKVLQSAGSDHYPVICYVSLGEEN